MNIFVDEYLYGNLGDDLFFEDLVKRYPRHTFTVISNFYKSKKYKNIKVHKSTITSKLLKNDLFKEKVFFKDFDAVIGLGGSLYMNNLDKMNGNESVYGNKDFFLLNTNFGRLDTEEYYKKYYDFFRRAKDICFRDKYSYGLFKSLPSVRSAADILFDIDPKYINVTNRKKVIIAVLSPNYKYGGFQGIYENKILQFIKFFKIQDYDVTLMSFCKEQGDEKAIESILQKTDEEVDTYYYRGNTDEALEVLGSSNIIIGSRLHANILGMALGKTIIPMIYDKKIANILREVGFDGVMIDMYDIANFKISSLTYENLNYVCDINKARYDAKNQFKVLDEYLLDVRDKKGMIDNTIFYEEEERRKIKENDNG